MATSSQSYDRRRRISAALRRLMPSGGHTWTVPVITLLLLLGLVAGAVIMSTVTRRHVQLDDGTVWVTSLKNQKAARFNVKNKEADAGVGLLVLYVESCGLLVFQRSDPYGAIVQLHMAARDGAHDHRAGNKSQKQQERDYGNRPRMPSGGHKAAQSRADASATIV